MAYVTLDIDGKQYNVQLAEISGIYTANESNSLIDTVKSSCYVERFAKPIKDYIPKLTGNETIKIVYGNNKTPLTKVVDERKIVKQCTCECTNTSFDYFYQGVDQPTAEIINGHHYRYRFQQGVFSIPILDFMPEQGDYVRCGYLNAIPTTSLMNLQNDNILQNNIMLAMFEVNLFDGEKIRCFGSIAGNQFVLSEFAYNVNTDYLLNAPVWGIWNTSFLRRYCFDESIRVFNPVGSSAGIPYFKNGDVIWGENNWNGYILSGSYRLEDVGKTVWLPTTGNIADYNNRYKNPPVNNPDKDAPIIPPNQDPDENGEESKGGGGDRDDTSDDIPLPKPENIVIPRLVTLYKMTETQVQLLGRALWTKNFSDSILSLNTNPLDAILFLHAHDIPLPENSTETIQIGNVEFPTIVAQIVENPFVRLNCGTVKINEYYGNWLDYNTDISIYLPHIGYRKLDSEIIMNSVIQLQYTVDLLSGKGLAQILVTKGELNSVMYQYEGDFSYSIPLSGRDYSNYNLGWITALAQKSLTKAISTQKQSNNILDSGNIGGNISFAGVKTPYLILTREIPYNSAWYNYNMYTWEGNAVLGTLHGETQIDCDIDITMDGITKEESEMIIQALRQGVIL